MPNALRALLTFVTITIVMLQQAGCSAAEPPVTPPEKSAPSVPATKPAAPPSSTAPAIKSATPPSSTARAAKPPSKETPRANTPPAKPKPAGIPEKVLKVLEYVDKNDKPMEGYEGGRNFGNFERRLPQTDSKGKRIRYREWDVNPRSPGVNRGAERMVTSSDGHAYYTSDHYETFKKIR